MSNRDDISKLYNYSNVLKKTGNILTWLNIAALSIMLLENDSIEQVMSIILIVTSMVFVAISITDNCVFWFNAESIRRIDLISNGFKLKIHEYQTDGYYNNNADPSIIKYAENAFESAFFSKNNSKRMLLTEGIKSLTIIVLFIVSCYMMPDIDIILIITQTTFSTFFVVGFIELCFYYDKVNNIYKLFYKEFITLGISDNKQMILVLAYTIEYEAIKAYFKVRLSKRIFDDNNKAWTKQWEDIEKQITIVKNVAVE